MMSKPKVFFVAFLGSFFGVVFGVTFVSAVLLYAVLSFGFTTSVFDDTGKFKQRTRSLLWIGELAGKITSDPKVLANIFGHLRLHNIPLPEGAPFEEDPSYLADAKTPYEQSPEMQKLAELVQNFTKERQDRSELPDRFGQGQTATAVRIPEVKKENNTINGELITHRGEFGSESYAAVSSSKDGSRLLYKWDKKSQRWKEHRPLSTIEYPESKGGIGRNRIILEGENIYRKVTLMPVGPSK